MVMTYPINVPILSILCALGHDANFTLKAGIKALGPLYGVAIKLVHLRIPARPSTI